MPVVSTGAGAVVGGSRERQVEHGDRVAGALAQALDGLGQLAVVDDAQIPLTALTTPT
jgi:hypothetical protein